MASWVDEEIKKAKRLSSRTLDISFRPTKKEEALVEIPDEVFTLVHLEELIIEDQKLRHISPLITKLYNLKKLNLAGNELVAFPKAILELGKIESLDLDGNEIETLSKGILDLSNLRYLGFGSYDRRTMLPSWMAEMRQLREIKIWNCESSLNHLAKMNWLHSLNITGTNLQAIPAWVFELVDLEDLRLTYSKLRTINREIVNMINLRSLVLWQNQIEQLPSNFGELLNLIYLDLDTNFLSYLPASFNKLQSLERLDLSGNRFSQFPTCLYSMPSIVSLSIGNWKNAQGDPTAVRLTSEILKMTNLEHLSLNSSQFEVPPPEVAEKGLSAIKDYFRQLRSDGVDYLYEAKLLIIGEGGAGKTSLANKILDPAYQLKEENTTQGIDVTGWTFALENGREFRVNIWDFGGQEIYHATHQFFLTKRSLYLLVADNRKEDTDFYYWLNILELLSDNSPVLIVQNEKQDRHKEIGERQLRSEFSGLKESLSTNLATNRGLSDIVKSIRYYISNLQHIGTPLPKSWVTVRTELERHADNFIDVDDYLEICSRNGFSELKDKLQLSAYLHDLGVFLHFQDDPLLKGIVILKPRWGTNAVYKVLDNKKVITSLGRFTESDLSDIWCEAEYEMMRHELLRLMINFKICYQIPGSPNSYIAPQLLTENQPSYAWDSGNNLISKYSYEFMPKGIVTQLIVAMHQFIGEGGIVWKSGVILRKSDASAEIIEYYGKREIQIRIRGKNKGDMLAIIDYEFDKIHSTYRHLRFSKLVPCNCKLCGLEPQPNFYKLEVLRKFVGDRQAEIQCQVSYQMVSVRGLLDDVGSYLTHEKEKQRAEVVFHGPIGKVIVQQSEKGNNQVSGTEANEMKSNDEKQVKSAWANGLFYLFTFAVVVAGMGYLAGHLPLYTLAVVVAAGILFILLIGVLQLRQDDRLSEKSFTELARLVIRQLPLIGKLAKSSANVE